MVLKKLLPVLQKHFSFQLNFGCLFIALCSNFCVLSFLNCDKKTNGNVFMNNYGRLLVEMGRAYHMVMAVIMGGKPYNELAYLRRTQRTLRKLISVLSCFKVGDMGILGRDEQKLFFEKATKRN